MEINILLTLLLMIISLGGAFLLGSKICLIDKEQTDLHNGLFHWAVKLVITGLHLLNIVILISNQNAAQTTLFQPQNLKFEG